MNPTYKDIVKFNSVRRPLKLEKTQTPSSSQSEASQVSIFGRVAGTLPESRLVPLRRSIRWSVGNVARVVGRIRASQGKLRKRNSAKPPPLRRCSAPRTRGKKGKPRNSKGKKVASSITVSHGRQKTVPSPVRPKAVGVAGGKDVAVPVPRHRQGQRRSEVEVRRATITKFPSHERKMTSKTLFPNYLEKVGMECSKACSFPP